MQVTNALGVEDYPTWSPDGRTLAYAANPIGDAHASNWDIWVTQVGGTQPLNRTPESAADDRFPSWSPDGKQLAFWSDRDGGGCYVMPALAGGARKVAAASPLDRNPPAWSSDGDELACASMEGSDVFVEIHNLQDGGSRRILLPGATGRRLFLSWSPDQKLFAYIDTPAGLSSDATQLWLLRLSDAKTFPVTDGRRRTWSPSWSPKTDALYFVSNLGGAMDLWQQRLSTDSTPMGVPERVTSGIGMRSATLSTDGSKLAYSQGRKVANVFRVPILPTGIATWSDARQITFDQAYIEFLLLEGETLGDGARLALEPTATVGISTAFGLERLDGDTAVESRVARAIHLAHSAGADPRDHFVWTEPRTRRQTHQNGSILAVDRLPRGPANVRFGT